MDLAQELNRMQLHAAFPKMDVDTVNDVFDACGGDAAQTRAMLLSMFGSTDTAAVPTPVQSPTSCGKSVPWSPVTAPGKSSIRTGRPILKLSSSVSGTSDQKSLDKPGHMISCVASVGPPTTLQDQDRMPKRLASPVQVGTIITSPPTAKLTASLLSSLMPPAPQPAPIPASTQTVEKRPVRPPLPRPVPLDGEPQTPTPARFPLPPHLEYLLCPPTLPAVSSPGSAKFEQGGWGESAHSSPVVPEGRYLPLHMRTASPVARAPAPASDLLGKSGASPDNEGSKLEFLHGVFSSMDPALVADVMHGVENNAEAAMRKLLALQVTLAFVVSLNSDLCAPVGGLSCICPRVRSCPQLIGWVKPQGAILLTRLRSLAGACGPHRGAGQLHRVRQWCLLRVRLGGQGS